MYYNTQLLLFEDDKLVGRITKALCQTKTIRRLEGEGGNSFSEIANQPESSLDRQQSRPKAERQIKNGKEGRKKDFRREKRGKREN